MSGPENPVPIERAQCCDGLSPLRPLIPLTLAFICGIVLGDRMPGCEPAAWIASAASCIGIGCCLRKRRAVLVLPLTLFVALGYLSIQHWASPTFADHHIHHFADGHRYRIGGICVDRPVSKENRTRFVLDVETLGAADRRLAVVGRIRVTAAGRLPDIGVGDRLRFSAKIRPFRNFNNPGGFDYKRYMAFRGIHGTAWVAGQTIDVSAGGRPRADFHPFDRMRQQTVRLIETGAAGDARAVLKALIAGDRSEISPRLRETFNRAGVGHLLAISGLHIGIVATVAFFAFRWILARFSTLLWHAWTEKGAAVLAFGPVLIYGLLSGMSPSTQRAVIMVGVFLAAIVFEKQQDTINTLAVAALVIVVVFPPSVFSVSFQLSFAAVWVILAGTKRILSAERPGQSGVARRLVRRAALFLAVSLLAILGTLPLTMAHFNQVSLIGLATNCIFVPFMGFVGVSLGLLAASLHILAFEPALWILRLDAHLMNHLLAILDFFGNLPFASVITITPSSLEIGCYYVLLTAVLVLIGGCGRTGSGRTAVIWMAAAAMIVLSADVLYWVRQRYGFQGLRVTQIDVGQGGCALVELPKGAILMVDGGGFSDNAAFDVGARVVAPFLLRKKIRTVDTVVLTHPNSDHLNGLLYVLDHFNVGEVWSNGEPAASVGYRRWMAAIRERNVSMPDYQRLKRLHRANGVSLHILYPPSDFMHRRTRDPWRDLNNNSLVLKVSYGDTSFLFTGDIMARAEAELVEICGPLLKSTVLMVPHHGSRTSSTQAFIDRVAPEFAVVSAGWRNRYRFPHPGPLQRYRKNGCAILRTDLHGAVALTSSGKTVTVKTRNPRGNPAQPAMRVSPAGG